MFLGPMDITSKKRKVAQRISEIVAGLILKFGVQIENHLGFTYEKVASVAREAEKLGFDGLFICDHLQGRTEDLAKQPCLDTWVTLGAIASTTERIELGTLVSAVGFRYPSLLAKMAATLDHISHGRLRLAIGAGWYEPEYASYGIPFPPVKQRMQELREGIQIIRTMWTRDESSFNGHKHRIKGAWCYPKPSRPKIWVGGTGEKTLLRIVADLADGWNATGTTAEEYVGKLKILGSYCTAVGRDLKELERSYYAPALMAGNEKDLLEVFREYYSRYKRPDETFEALVHRVRGGNRSFIGTKDEVIEKIAKFSKLGISYLMFYFPDKHPQGQLKQFGEQIIPVFRNESS